VRKFFLNIRKYVWKFHSVTEKLKKKKKIFNSLDFSWSAWWHITWQASTNAVVRSLARLFAKCQVALAKDLFGLHLKLLPVTTSLTTQRYRLWASVAGGPRPPWIFIHGTDIAHRSLIVLFFGRLAPLEEA